MSIELDKITSKDNNSENVQVRALLYLAATYDSYLENKTPVCYNFLRDMYCDGGPSDLYIEYDEMHEETYQNYKKFITRDQEVS